jgi:hypothetical protein
VDKFWGAEITAQVLARGCSHLLPCLGWDIIDSDDKDLRGRPLMNIRVVMPLMATR